MTQPTAPQSETDVLVIGAGVVGIYALYRALDAGFTAQTLEAGEEVGGVWFWNRYPAARFDSESYTYGYLFSRELFTEWQWAEEFATQPEVESYLNHVVDRFSLRDRIHTGRRVVAADWDEQSARWTVSTADGATVLARWVVSATGGLSVPHYPEIEGLSSFGGEGHHTGAWPRNPIDFAEKRVAIIGNGPSGAQLLPAIVGIARSVDFYQRTATWVTPLNNAPITDEKRDWLAENFDHIAHVLSTSPSGFLHEPSGRFSTDDSAEERQAFFETMWASPGFAKLTANYFDLTTNHEVNREFCDFLATKIRAIVDDPAVADRLIPKDQLFGAKRPPFVTGYYEAFNDDSVELVSLRETPITRITPTGIDTTAGAREYDIIVYATGFDFGTGALTRMGVRGTHGFDLRSEWESGPSDFGGFSSQFLPNFFFPGGPHGAGGGNYPRYSQDQVDWIITTMRHARANGYNRFEPTAPQQTEWMEMIDELAPRSIFSAEHSHYYGANVEGKPRKFLLNPGGRAKLHEILGKVVSTLDYGGALTTSSSTLQLTQ